MTSIAGLAAAVYFAYNLPLRRSLRWQWLLVLASGVRSRHILITILTCGFDMILIRIVAALASWRAAVPVVLVLIVVVAGLLAGFSLRVDRVYERSAVRPPFITAQLASEKPGKNYLRATGFGNGLRICDFLSKLPKVGDDFFWSREPDKRVVRNASKQVKRALSAKQVHIAVDVLRYHFAGQTESWLNDSFEQLSHFSLSEFAYNPALKSYFLTTLPQDLIGSLQRQKLFEDRFPL